MTIKQLLNLGIGQIHKTSASPFLDAEVLLSFVLRKPKSHIFVHTHKYVPLGKQKEFFNLIAKKQKGWPVAYLTGQKEFYGLNFTVNKNILIPRPETEELVDIVIKNIHGYKKRDRAFCTQKIKILDIGTGSGCIIISLARKLNVIARSLDRIGTTWQSNQTKKSPLHARDGKLIFFASDISSQALKIAKLNAHQHKVKIKFKKGNLLQPWEKQYFDIIVANLPYGWKEWKNNTSAETIGLKFEPEAALFASKKGLALYGELFKQIHTLSPTPYAIFVEFDPRQTKQIKKMAKKFLPDYSLEIKKDLAGRNRFACLSPHYLL